MEFVFSVRRFHRHPTLTPLDGKLPGSNNGHNIIAWRSAYSAARLQLEVAFFIGIARGRRHLCLVALFGPERYGRFVKGLSFEEDLPLPRIKRGTAAGTRAANECAEQYEVMPACCKTSITD